MNKMKKKREQKVFKQTRFNDIYNEENKYNSGQHDDDKNGNNQKRKGVKRKFNEIFDDDDNDKEITIMSLKGTVLDYIEIDENILNNNSDDIYKNQSCKSFEDQLKNNKNSNKYDKTKIVKAKLMI